MTLPSYISCLSLIPRGGCIFGKEAHLLAVSTAPCGSATGRTSRVPADLARYPAIRLKPPVPISPTGRWSET
ncbi:MAG: hypothetical protein PHP59_09085 [Methanofollis sp.]|uniref:hypothetical protein n=1 Tax=Methanofollis sp. TaxID=2052835 RepID=UPI002603987D|nr:hypothetical protein [Methanofollis sp.]MDD4255513.1 hypothetical protein [Methanofollis sp.]